jgi:hypothetical protein
MRISEVIDPETDLFDILNLPILSSLDQLYSGISNVTNEFSVPLALLNQEIVEELRWRFLELTKILEHKKLPTKWKDQINEIQHWFETY